MNNYLQDYEIILVILGRGVRLFYIILIEQPNRKSKKICVRISIHSLEVAITCKCFRESLSAEYLQTYYVLNLCS